MQKPAVLFAAFFQKARTLFDTVVQVAGHTRKDGTYVRPHRAKRKIAADSQNAQKQRVLFFAPHGEQPAPKQPTLLFVGQPRPQPTEEKSPEDRLKETVEKMGGPDAVSEAIERNPGIVEKLAEAGGIPVARVREVLDVAPPASEIREAKGIDEDHSEEETDSRIKKRSQQAAKLREAGQKVIAAADEEINRPRNMNTARRARMGNGAIEDAEKRQRIGQTMVNLAAAIESGEAQYLSGVTTRAAVEALDRELRRAMKFVKRDPTPDDVAAADLPELRLWGPMARSYANDLKDEKSPLTKMLRQRADSVGEDGKVMLSHDEAKSLIKDLEKKGGNPWHIKTDAMAITRLNKLGVHTRKDLQLALAEYAKFRDGSVEKPDPIKVAEEAVRFLKIPGYFPTPKGIVSTMIERAGISPGMRVLEPSAGKGDIADQVRFAGVAPDVVEMSSSLQNVLTAKGYNTIGSDFLGLPVSPSYDAVVMNPPFEGQQDVDHVQRAFEFLKPGGTLVAIMSESPFFRSNQKSEDFRNWLEKVGGESEKLPDGSFKSSDRPTGVSTRMVVVKKPDQSDWRPSAEETGPKEGDTREDGGVTYVLRGGRWRRETPEEEETGAASSAPTQTPKIKARRAQRPRTATAAVKTPDYADADDLDPNSPNYRFRDTGYVAGSRKEEAAAATIRRMSRSKERVRSTDIDWTDLETNPREAADVITKSHLFGEVDWDALQGKGMDPGAGWLIDRIYASIAPKPSEESPQARQDYTLGLESLRDRLETCITPNQVTDVLREIRDEFEGEMLTEEETTWIGELQGILEVMSKARVELRSEIEELQKDANRLGNELSNARWDQKKRIDRKWKPNPELDQRIVELSPRHDAAWDKVLAWKAAHPEFESKRRDLGGGWVSHDSDIEFEERKIRDQISAIRTGAKLRNKIENPIHRAWQLMGERFIGVLKYRSMRGGSDAFAQHVAGAKRGKIADWDWVKKERVTVQRERAETVRFQLKVADSYERVGGREVVVDSTSTLKGHFNLREVQSGNWVLSDPGAAKFHVEHTAAAFADLADILGVPDNFVSMNGRLAMAFGARGRGNAGFGGAARAHWEGTHRIINLTKMGGGGALAHEWFHALDNLLPEASGGESKASSTHVTENPLVMQDREIRSAFDGLLVAMRSGPHQSTKSFVYTAEDVRLAKHNLKDGGGWTQIGKKIAKSGDLSEALRHIDASIVVGGRNSRKAQKNKDGWTRIAVAHFGGNADGGEIEAKFGSPKSAFAIEAEKLDEGKKTPYWAANDEMAARAFQGWCEDRLAEMGRKNDYLSNHASNEHYRSPLTGEIEHRPFPEGEERKKINAAFDRLVDVIRSKREVLKAFAALGGDVFLQGIDTGIPVSD